MKRKYCQPKCPKCGKDACTVVKNTYFTENNELLRYRHCQLCDWKFWTYQELEVALDPTLFAVKIPRWGNRGSAKKKIELVMLN